MRIFFSLDFKGGMAYMGMKKQPLMMDTQVVDLNGLFEFLELRLGLHAAVKPDMERLVDYFKCVRQYMKEHRNDSDNQLFDSYTVSPLAASREMLKWRDALAVCGWNQDTPVPSRRLKVLQGVERIFAEKETADMHIRQENILERLRQKKGRMEGVTFILPYNPELLHPALKTIFADAVADGAIIEILKTPEITGDSNLTKLKRMLTDGEAGKVAFDPNDTSVRIWRFKDEMEAEEYLTMSDQGEYDVWVQRDTKLTDNFLHMMGKPVTGSQVSNSAPQIIQLFFTGVAILSRPLNISALLQWLYAPIHPLPFRFRQQLAECLALNGGWYAMEGDDRARNCRMIVDEWMLGRTEKQNGTPLDKKELKTRKQKVEIFLPDFNDADNMQLTAGQFHLFLTELGAWSRQMSAIMAEKDPQDPRIPQLKKLSDLCETMKSLTDDLNPEEAVPFAEIEKHMACLYEATEFVQFKAQAGARFTVNNPGQVVVEVEKVMWADIYNYEPDVVATDFLTPTETEVLKDHVSLWNKDDLRKIQQQTMFMPILFCQKEITMVTVETAGGELVNKHPLIVRIEQQVENHRQITSTPEIPDTAYVPVTAMPNNALSGSDGLYTHIHNTDLIKWKEKESPTSIEKLIQNPVDYALENIAYIRDNGQSALSNINMTKGNVAHGVIQQLFYIPKKKKSGYPAEIIKRVKASYSQVFDKVVKAKGAVLLLQENIIDRRQLFDQLKECIEHLIDIIDRNGLHVTACEQDLRGYTFGNPDGETPTMLGFADMVLANEEGQHFIFDFKWTSSKSYYPKLLEENRSSQLAIYAQLLSELTDDKQVPTAYFLMPEGRLYSNWQFTSYWAKQVDVDEECEGDIIRQIVASYRYRREEIMSGKIEMGEGAPLEMLDYFNDTEARFLFPLKPDYVNKDVKEIYGFSNYKNLKQ